MLEAMILLFDLSVVYSRRVRVRSSQSHDLHVSGRDQWCWLLGLHAEKATSVHNCPRRMRLHVINVEED